MIEGQEFLQLVIDALNSSADTNLETGIPIGISNRHIHLSEEDRDNLFGIGYQLTKTKELSQPGQYACAETVTVCGPKGVIEKVRVLGPPRKCTQIEILSADCFKLGISAPIKQSGDLSDSPGVTLIGPKGAVIKQRGAIVAQRHIHMHPYDAEKYKVTDNEIVSIKISGNRGGVFDNVIIRVDEQYRLECHLDIEEANAMGLNSRSKVYIIKNN